jgi:hypothetical protein
VRHGFPIKNSWASLIVLCGVLSQFAQTARAQSQSDGFSISGIVSDPSGGSTPGITLTSCGCTVFVQAWLTSSL